MSYAKSVKQFAVIMGIVFMCASQTVAKNMFTLRTVLLPNIPLGGSVQVPYNELLGRMNKVGYNAITLYGLSLRHMHKNDQILAGAKEFVAEAKRQEIEIIPMSQVAVGSDFYPKDLVEAFPNKATRFVVQNGVAKVKEDPDLKLLNGDFEKPLSSWRNPTGRFKIDSTVKKSGNSSVRCDDPQESYVRLTQWVDVKPNQTYELSAWVHSQDIVPIDTIKVPLYQALSGCMFSVRAEGQYILQSREGAGVQPNKPWKQFKQRFYSMHHTKVNIWLQTTYGYGVKGKIWLDDVEIREMGLEKTVNRINMPVVVKTTDDRILKEGTDYTVGTGRLTIPDGSSVKNGDELLVDWFTAGGMIHKEPYTAFCYDEVWNGMREEIKFEDTVFENPRIRSMFYEEWRMAGWDPGCGKLYDIDNMGSGPYMAATANITMALYQEANGNRIGQVYNDMYDPYHLSLKPYYMTKGGTLGSGHLLREDIVIANWNGLNPKRSILYFAGLDTTNHKPFGVKRTKQRQFLYCLPGVLDRWLDTLTSCEQNHGLPDDAVPGIGYFWWYNDGIRGYDSRVEAFAAICQESGRWGKGPFPLPERAPGIPYDGNPFPSVKHDPRKEVSGGVSLSEMGRATPQSRTFRFSFPTNGHIRLSLFDLRGRLVCRVIDGKMAAGTHERKLDVSKMAPGVYFARLEVSGQNIHRISKKMILF